MIYIYISLIISNVDPLSAFQCPRILSLGLVSRPVSCKCLVQVVYVCVCVSSLYLVARQGYIYIYI